MSESHLRATFTPIVNMPTCVLPPTPSNERSLFPLSPAARTFKVQGPKGAPDRGQHVPWPRYGCQHAILWVKGFAALAHGASFRGFIQRSCSFRGAWEAAFQSGPRNPRTSRTVQTQMTRPGLGASAGCMRDMVRDKVRGRFWV